MEGANHRAKVDVPMEVDKRSIAVEDYATPVHSGLMCRAEL